MPSLKLELIRNFRRLSKLKPLIKVSLLIAYYSPFLAKRPSANLAQEFRTNLRQFANFIY